MRSLLKPLFSFISIVLIALGTPLFALAQNETTPAAETGPPEVIVSIRPEGSVDGTRFEASAAPGETVQFNAVIENFGEAAVNLRTFASHVVPTLNGGLSVAGPDEEKTGFATWVTYPNEDLVLQPSESVQRTITVQVPNDAVPGQYVTAVVLETVDPVQTQGMIRQFFRKVVSVYVTVPGETVTDFTLGEPELVIEEGRAGVLIPVENTGNVRLELEVEFELNNPDGSVFFANRSRLGVIYMGQSTYMLFGFINVPPPGDYTFSLTATDMDTQVSHSLDSVAVSPPEVEEVVAESPVALNKVEITPNADPIVFANVNVELEPVSASYRSSRLTLIVNRDGELVEEFVLAESLTLPLGEVTTVTQRYLPATNWESGTYTFNLRLETVDGGTANLLFEEEDVATLEVP